MLVTLAKDSGKCTCNALYKNVYPISTLGSESVQLQACELCPQATTTDKSSCVTCSGAVDTNGFCTCSNVLIERDSYGALLDPPTCQTCDASTSGSSCQICPFDWPLTDGSSLDTCACQNQIGAVCFANSIGSEGSTLQTIQRAGNSRNSDFISSNMFQAYRGCKERRDAVSCNLLANICILQWADSGACSLLADCELETEISDRISWKQSLPWIGPFRQSEFTIITGDVSISTQFSYTTNLDLVAAVYQPDGTFSGYETANNGLLQLCTFPESQMKAAWAFAAPHSVTCSRPASALWSRS